MPDLTKETYQQLQQAAIRLLARREHSEYELTQKLLTKLQDETLVRSVVLSMQQAGYQSDERFVEALVYHRKQKGYGPNKILHELRHHQVDAQLITQYLDANDEDWCHKAQEQRKKHFKQLPQLPKDVAKQSRYLYNRGFTSTQIAKALEKDE